MSEHDDRLSLEQALARTEADATAVLKATSAFAAAVKKVQAAARVGNLRDLRPALSAADQTLQGVRQQFTNSHWIR